ncbi:MAG: hypothetical protein QM757_08015 [Paludibaculum sp.]
MKLAALCLALALGAVCPQAGASTLQLTQGGWDQGGPLTILFTGDDLDLSGSIDTAQLTSFSASSSARRRRRAPPSPWPTRC